MGLRRCHLTFWLLPEVDKQCKMSGLQIISDVHRYCGSQSQMTNSPARLYTGRHHQYLYLALIRTYRHTFTQRFSWTFPNGFAAFVQSVCPHTAVMIDLDQLQDAYIGVMFVYNYDKPREKL